MGSLLELNLATFKKFAAVLLTAGAGVAGLYCVGSFWRNLQKRGHLTSLRKRKQKECAERLEELKNRYTLGPKEVAIVSLPFEELVEKLQKREISARKVLEAFIAKAVEVTCEFNCVTEFVPQCLDWADALDALPEPKGPLHGIPFCVKDDHDIKGMDTTLGCSIFLYQPAKDTAVVVKVLMDAGAIPFCKTNLTQTTISGASDNPIYGTTLNPLNRDLGPGGSSSGTACLVAAGGAPFGTGSDLGGSVRMPANACGLATLRPTIRRNSGLGHKQAYEDLAGYTSVSGIIASSVKVLTYVSEVMWKNAVQCHYDPLVVPLTWNKEEFIATRPLRIGFYTSLDFFPAFPDVIKTVLHAKSTLKKLGHTVVEFQQPDVPKILQVYIALQTADGGNQLNKILEHDAISHVAEKIVRGRKFPSNAVKFLRSWFVPHDAALNFAGDPAAQRSQVLWDYLKQLRLLKYELLDEMERLNVDALLGPVLPFPALKVMDAEELTMKSFGYTGMWNGLDFPAGVLPFGKETGSRVNEYDDRGDYYLKLAKENVKVARGMPIGVQIIAKPFQEERVLRILTELEGAKKKTSEI